MQADLENYPVSTLSDVLDTVLHCMRIALCLHVLLPLEYAGSGYLFSMDFTIGLYSLDCCIQVYLKVMHLNMYSDVS